jgi:oleate hydratase
LGTAADSGFTSDAITMEWLYLLGCPVNQIEDMAEHGAKSVSVMMPYVASLSMPCTKADRPDVIRKASENYSFIRQFAESGRGRISTCEYAVRNAMLGGYILLVVERSVREV